MSKTNTATATEIFVGVPFVGSQEQQVGGGVPVTGGAEEERRNPILKLKQPSSRLLMKR